MIYLWIKAAHISAVIAFIAGLLAESTAIGTLAGIGSGPSRQAAFARVRWFSGSLTTPAMLLTWGFGLTLAVLGQWFPSPWLIAKLVFVVGLSGFHGVLSGSLRRLAGGDGAIDVRTPAVWNLIIIGSVTCIAILVITKPF